MKHLCQYPTPAWIAEALVERHFSALDSRDTVIEPSCGAGAFLHAIPANVPAIGVEIDARLADEARAATGRRIICGDFRAVTIDVTPTAIIGNPPFSMELIDTFLQRAHELLPDGGRVGFILPAHTFQTASRVVGYGERWSIAHELIPRNIYPRLSLPLLFAIFSKDRQRTLIGFALYREAYDAARMDEEYRQAMHAGAGVWRRVVAIALRRLGGEARLPDIYAEIEGHRPTASRFWQEKVRQTLRAYSDFVAIETGRYRLAEAA